MIITQNIGGNMKKFLIVMVCVLFLTAGLTAGEKCKTCKHEPIVEQLATILKAKPALQDALLVSLKKADRLDAPTLPAYFKFLDDMVTLIPTDRNLYAHIVGFYYLIDFSPNGILQKDVLFQQWTLQFAKDWGSFLDTPRSAKGVKTFLMDPDFHMDDYQVGPSGWRTFNQFFARQLKPGKRPIDDLCDDRIVVSPADSTMVGCWRIDEKSKIHVKGKGKPFSVMDLLDCSPYKDRFKGGVFMHSFLNVNDYHRYHVPVGGEVLEAREIYGKVVLEVEKWKDGSLHAVDDTGYQFTQARGLIILDSPMGLVAVLPIGMAQVSSCNITAEVGATLHKGEEFGYFLFGGSDIIVMFEAKSNVSVCATPNVHYNQGKTIARFGKPCPGKKNPCPPPIEEPCHDKKQN